MGKKICPICDSPLGIGNFCTACRRRVRTPIIVSSDMHLNECHPAKEADSFHAKENEKKDKAEKMIVIAAAAVLSICLFAVLCGAANFFVGGTAEVEVIETVPEEVQPQTLTLEEARAIADRCDIGHIPVDKAVLLECMRTWYTESGYTLNYESNEIDNEIDYYGEERYLWFLDLTCLALGKGDLREQDYQLELSSDSVSGEFHSLMATLKTKEDVSSLLLQIGAELESAPDVSADESQLLEYAGHMEFSQDGEGFETEHASYFYCEVEEGYFLYISSME